MKLKLVSKIKALIDGTSEVQKVVDCFDSWSADQKQAFVDESFYKIVHYAYYHVPYYHQLFIDHNLKPNDFTSIDSIIKIPILTKDAIRNNYEKLYSNELSKITFQSRRSGGTTGEPIRSLISKEAAAYETFSYFKGLLWMGWKPGMTFVKLFGGSLGIRKPTSLRQKVYEYVTDSIQIPAFELNKKNIAHYYDLLKHEKVVCLIGYASAIANFVSLLKDRGLYLKNVQLVITTSEQLIEDWRLSICEYFNCPIRSYYGCGEIGSLGYQIKDQDTSYKIPLEHAYLENSENSEEILITQLHNKSQPLIRYSNGDNGIIGSQFGEKRILNLIGRSADYFKRSDGSLVSPILGTYSIQRSNIPVKKYQYIQKGNGDIEFHYTMEYGSLTNEHKRVIIQIINYVMEEKVNIDFIDTDNFIVGSTSKHRICVSLIN